MPRSWYFLGCFLCLWILVLSHLSPAKNTVISPNFMVWKFCGRSQFPHSFERIVRNYEETVPFHKSSASWNYVKLRYFSEWKPIWHIILRTSRKICSNDNWRRHHINKLLSNTYMKEAIYNIQEFFVILCRPRP